MSTRVAAIAPPAAPAARKAAPPCAMVIFGATGDLTRRKLVPALYNLAHTGLLPESFAAVGFARRPWSDAMFRDEMSRGVAEFSRLAPLDHLRWERFGAQLEYLEGGFDDPAAYARLSERLTELDRERGLAGNRLFYLAVPPAEVPTILHRLKGAGLIYPPDGGSWSRAIVEKPFGRDLESARALNGLLARVLHESQTFRIDHYLGKETVQNILVFRFANSIWEPLWNRRYVDYVEICAAETIGVGTRGRFYEQTGVLRDIVQSHLLEVLSLTAMEPPTTGGADDIRTEKLKVLNALRDPSEDTIARDIVLGQYRGYRDETDVAPDSVTATYAALRVFVDNWRWQGVPFYLRTGKKMAKRVTEISLHMRAIPLVLFGRGDLGDRIEPNVLTLRIQPDEGIAVRFACKVPGLDLQVGTVAMDMNYLETFGGEPPEAYERLLLDAMRGDATLFSRRDAVEASWAWITPILQYFERHPPLGLPNYGPGSWGPECALELMRRDRRAWREL